MNSFVKGDPVQVYSVWASNGPVKPPSAAWFSGFEFERCDGGTILVREVRDGLFHGLLIRYPEHCVRAFQ